MSCERYDVGGTPLSFSEIDDSIGCLCTFPLNDGDTLVADRIRLLAYLGAAVVLESRGELESSYLPACLPEWIRKEIDAHIT